MSEEVAAIKSIEQNPKILEARQKLANTWRDIGQIVYEMHVFKRDNQIKLDNMLVDTEKLVAAHNELFDKEQKAQQKVDLAKVVEEQS